MSKSVDRRDRYHRSEDDKVYYTSKPRDDKPAPVDTGLTELKDSVSKICEAVNQYQEATKNRFQKLDDRFDGLEKRVDELVRVTGGLQGQSTKLNAVAINHGERLDQVTGQQDQKLRALIEEYLKATEPQPAPQPKVAPAPQPQPQQKEAIPVASCVAGTGFTGKALVFFIHGEDGRIDWSRPFYSPNVAKQYDWRYAIVPSWVQNDQWMRVLTADEAAGVLW